MQLLTAFFKSFFTAFRRKHLTKHSSLNPQLDGSKLMTFAVVSVGRFSNFTSCDDDEATVHCDSNTDLMIHEDFFNKS
jgi:hypothetical protein